MAAPTERPKVRLVRGIQGRAAGRLIDRPLSAVPSDHRVLMAASLIYLVTVLAEIILFTLGFG